MEIHSRLHDHDFGRLAPGTHDALEPRGADAHPHSAPRSVAAQGGFAATKYACVCPSG